MVGYGLSAKVFHIPLILTVPEFTLHAIVQRSPKPDDDAEKDHRGVKAYRSIDDIVKDEKLEVIVLTTSPDTHFAMAKLALEAGKHVIVEKPFTPTPKEADELVALASKHGRLLSVYQNRRWDSDFLTLSKYISNGSLGRVVEFETHFDRHRPAAPKDNWKLKQAGGTAIYDLGTHLIDQVVHLYGLPKRITGFLGSQRQPNPSGFEDSCTVLLHYDGMLATVKAGVVSPEVNQLRYWVRGVKGSFKKYHLDCQEDQLRAGMKPGDIGFGLEPKERYGILTSAKDDGTIESEVVPTVEPATYAEYYRKFARAVNGDPKQLPVDPAVAASVIKLIELAAESSRTGRTLDV